MREGKGLDAYTDDELAKASAMLTSEFMSIFVSPQFTLASKLGLPVAVAVVTNIFASSFLGQLVESGAINPKVLAGMVDTVASSTDDAVARQAIWGDDTD
jgi:hypothetical protein